MNIKPVSPPVLPALLWLTLLAPLPAFAGHPSVPGGAAAEGSQSTEIQPAFAFFGGVYQNIYTDLPGGLAESGLKIGDIITGISLRLDSSVSSSDGAYFDRFDIRIGVGKANLVSTMAANFFGTVTQARTGPLLLLPQDMPTSGSPRSFGKVIKFDTPYVYGGGNLLIETRVQGNTSMTVDTIDTTNKVGMVSDESDADATTGTVSVGPAWAMAFEVIRGGKPTLTNVDIPNGATEAGGGSWWGIPFTFQFLYPASSLQGLNPGDRICGFCLRLGPEDTSSGSATFSRFDVHIGKAASTFQTSSGTAFAANFDSPPTMARSGPLTLLLPTAQTIPRPFGGFVDFDAPYTYTGGDLVIEWRVSVGNAGNKIGFVSGTGISSFDGPDATTSVNPMGSVPAVQLKVNKAPVVMAPNNAARKKSLAAMIRKVKVQIKRAKKVKNLRKVRTLSKKLQRLVRTLRTL